MRPHSPQAARRAFLRYQAVTGAALTAVIGTIGICATGASGGWVALGMGGACVGLLAVSAWTTRGQLARLDSSLGLALTGLVATSLIVLCVLAVGMLLPPETERILDVGVLVLIVILPACGAIGAHRERVLTVDSSPVGPKS